MKFYPALENCVRFAPSLIGLLVKQRQQKKKKKACGEFLHQFTKHAFHIARYTTLKAESLKKKSLVYKNLTRRSIDDFRGVSKLKIKLEISGRGANFQLFFDDHVYL